MSKDSPDQKGIATELQEAVPDHTHSRKTALIRKGLRRVKTQSLPTQVIGRKTALIRKGLRPDIGHDKEEENVERQP